MSIITNPITLPASKFLSTITALIGEIRFNSTLEPSEIVDDLVESCRIGKVDYGKGIINDFKLDVQPVNDLSETSTVTKITKPNIAQETIEIDQYKFIPLSISEVLTKDSALSGEIVSRFLDFVMSLLEDTLKFHLYDIMVKDYMDWTPGQATQTVQINQIDTTSLTGADLEYAERWNATQIGKVMRKTFNNMRIKNNKFTDIANYTDVNDGSTVKKVVSALSRDNLKIVFNDKYYTDFLADAMASLYHSEKVGEMIPGERFVLLPEDSVDTDNTKTIAWLSAKNKFALADFYKLTLSFADASTLYVNYFLHVSYGHGVFEYAPGVKFVANLISPPSAG